MKYTIQTAVTRELVGIATNDALDPIATDATQRFDRIVSAVTDEFEPETGT